MTLFFGEKKLEGKQDRKMSSSLRHLDVFFFFLVGDDGEERRENSASYIDVK